MTHPGSCIGYDILHQLLIGGCLCHGQDQGCIGCGILGLVLVNSVEIACVGLHCNQLFELVQHTLHPLQLHLGTGLSESLREGASYPFPL